MILHGSDHRISVCVRIAIATEVAQDLFQVLEQQVEVLQDMLTAAERKLRERESNSLFR